MIFRRKKHTSTIMITALLNNLNLITLYYYIVIVDLYVFILYQNLLKILSNQPLL